MITEINNQNTLIKYLHDIFANNWQKYSEIIEIYYDFAIKLLNYHHDRISESKMIEISNLQEAVPVFYNLINLLFVILTNLNKLIHKNKSLSSSSYFLKANNLRALIYKNFFAVYKREPIILGKTRESSIQKLIRLMTNTFKLFKNDRFSINYRVILTNFFCMVHARAVQCRTQFLKHRKIHAPLGTILLFYFGKFSSTYNVFVLHNLKHVIIRSNFSRNINCSTIFSIINRTYHFRVIF